MGDRVPALSPRLELHVELFTNMSREIDIRRRTDESLARVMARMKVTRDRTTYMRYGRRKGGWSRRMDSTAGIVK